MLAQDERILYFMAGAAGVMIIFALCELVIALLSGMDGDDL